jgi:hypothetical protein
VVVIQRYNSCVSELTGRGRVAAATVALILLAVQAGHLMAQGQPEPEEPILSAMRKTLDFNSATPETIAKVYWQTVLLSCGDSLLYSEKNHPTPKGTVWTVHEFKGPFKYPLEIKQATRGESLNGLIWRAQSLFRPAVERMTALNLYAPPDTRDNYKEPWSEWGDLSPDSEVYRVTIEKDRGGIKLKPTSYMQWEPMSCSTATAVDPFAEYKVRVRK